MSRRAVVLAGGKGTRLRPYTVVLPKPLMPLGDYPILEVIVRQLAQCNFDHVTMAVNHQANIIKAFFGSGESWNLHIDYSLENMPLSTIAPLRLIDDLPEDFLLINGDILTDLDFDCLFREHAAAHQLFTIAASRRRQAIDYGVLEADPSNMLTRFTEKPSVEYLVSMGVYVMSPKVLPFLVENAFLNLPDYITLLKRSGARIGSYVHEGYWLDIGRREDYERACREAESLCLW